MQWSALIRSLFLQSFISFLEELQFCFFMEIPPSYVTISSVQSFEFFYILANIYSNGSDYYCCKFALHMFHN